MLFANTTFKVAPGSRAYDLITCCYVFIESRTSHPARCYWLEATHRCPEVDAQKRSRAQQNEKIQAEGRVSAHTNTLLVGLSDD